MAMVEKQVRIEEPPQATEKVEEREEEEELDYATLAKLGGRKDLLVHKEYINKSQAPLPYPWVEWFDHYPPPQLPLVATGAVSAKANLLAWNTTECSLPISNRRVRLQNTRQRKLTYPQHIPVKKPGKIKLPSLTNDTPVHIGKLLAMDYQKEWVEDNKKRLREERIKQQEKKEIQKQKLIEHTMKARKIAGVDRTDEEDRPQRFIMKRFSNVPGKLKLPPL